MKFNWRANWEILLVLVIIVVGITITTIAAIRNKDKQLIPLPEETDFSQLLGNLPESSTNGSASLESDERDSLNRRPSSLNAHQSSGKGRHSSYHHPAIRELHNVGRLNTVGGSDGRQSKYDENPQADQQQQFSGLINRQPVLLADPHSLHHHHHVHPQQHHQLQQQELDQYEAMSTEPTPNQIRSIDFAGQALPSAHQNSMIILHRHQPMNNQTSGSGTDQEIPTNSQQQQPQQPPQEVYTDQLGDSVDLIDDIHTTRSSLASTNLIDSSQGVQPQSPQQQPPPAPHHSPVMNHFAPVNLLPEPINTANLNSMHSLPYGALNHQLSQLLAHQQANNNHKQHTEQPAQHSGSSLLDPNAVDDMMTSYTRYPVVNNSNNSMAEALLRDYALNSGNSTVQLLNSAVLANLMTLNPGQPTQQQPQSNHGQSPTGLTSSLDPHSAELFSQQSGQMTPTNVPTIHHQRRFASSLPISMLISDLLKLARPQQQNLSSQVEPTKTHPSILQQLRSLPGPLLNLIQGLSGPPIGPAQHDASESNQHYHRISIPLESLAHPAFARSTQFSSVLPAFPAPKGVPQTWIPPTIGGNANYHTAHNNNADFVASNTAGFLRVVSQPQTQQQQQQMSAARADEQSPISPGNHNSYPQQPTSTATQQQPAEVSMIDNQHYQRPSGGEFYQQQQHQPSVDINQQQQQTITKYQTQQQPQNLNTFNLDQQQQVLNSGEQLIAPFTSQQNGPNFSAGRQNKNFPAFTGLQQHLLDKQLVNSQGHFNLATLNSQPQSPFASIYRQAVEQQQQQQQQQQIPLGYSGTGIPQIVINQQQQTSSNRLTPLGLEYSSAGGVESAPKVSVTSAVSSTSKQPLKKSTLSRRKRSAQSSSHQQRSGSDQLMSGRYGSSGTAGEDEEEEDGDSRPISVVSPDGRPTNSGRVRGYTADQNEATSDSQVAQSQRQANHMNLKSQQQHEYEHEQDQPERDLERGFLPVDRSALYLFGGRRGAEQVGGHSSTGIGYEDRDDSPDQLRRPLKHLTSSADNESKSRDTGHKEGEASRLMSKLLGTASNRDETEDDADDDEEANERRKEELEDAEFGILNQQPVRNFEHQHRSLKLGGSDSSSSGSTDSGTEYTPRRDQRSDIEFYGHPGEETRTLKYGILGSGNYEVVNGGVYTEADAESTAAVNSVANYVRKPGALLAAKLLAEREQQAAFGMPGARLSSGFMRGASAQLEEGLTVAHLLPESMGGHKQLSNPLLELIDANGAQVFEANMLAHLGSSTRTSHASQPSEQQQHQQQVASPLSSSAQSQTDDASTSDEELDEKRDAFLNRKQPKSNRGKSASSEVSNELSTADNNSELDSPEEEPKSTKGKGGKARSRMNQFNSYQILPSKKVTIFSDQDLDSAPSEIAHNTYVNTNQHFLQQQQVPEEEDGFSGL